jgi:DNA-binding response OmpR family regulator
MGISKEEIPKLFDRFYQVDSSQTREHEGTGIGLALTKELVELHKGTINVSSNKGDPDLVGTGWTEFTIELPLGREHLSSDEIVELVEPVEEETIVNEEEYLSPTSGIQTEMSNEIVNDKTIILVVEDNAEVRKYIKDSLGEEHQVEEAVNGEQGVEKAEKIIPDLIISDIMMPKMDGNELTRLLKNDEKTSHIPIILLTAKSEQESKIEGLETGADAYLTKPFNAKELQVRIKNLINIRKKLQEKFRIGYFLPKQDEKKLSSLDEQFMYKVVEVIEQHISEEEFSIIEFAREVGMSRSQIHRKLRALTGKSPSRYIRMVRLTRGRKLIEERAGNISEIAYLVGFSSPIYFAKCFKDEYGFPPSELVK